MGMSVCHTAKSPAHGNADDGAVVLAATKCKFWFSLSICHHKNVGHNRGLATCYCLVLCYLENDHAILEKITLIWKMIMLFRLHFYYNLILEKITVKK